MLDLTFPETTLVLTALKPVTHTTTQAESPQQENSQTANLNARRSSCLYTFSG